MSKFDKYTENISICNCNARLTELYKTRDDIGHKIDKATYSSSVNLVELYEQEYDSILDAIYKLCAFRRNHSCLLEGDIGYTLW